MCSTERSHLPVRIPVVIELSEEALRVLGQALINQQGGTTLMTTLSTTAAIIELPTDWTLIEEREGETYSWPEGPDEYETFRIYEGTTSEGTVRLGLGACERQEVRGKARRYVIAHFMTAGGSKRPIAEFLEVDDYADSGDLVAVIKGKGGGAKMYDPTDDLPAEYEGFRIETYRDRIDAPGSYEKLGVVAHEDDVATMLGHTLIQAQSRSGLGPA